MQQPPRTSGGSAGSAAPRVHLMENLYPCLPSEGRQRGHEGARQDPWRPGREAACSLALSRAEYEAALDAAMASGEAPPFRENYEVCLCREPLPLLPPRCPLDAPTCGAYPNDPAKMPAPAALLTDAQLLGFCTTRRDDAASDIYDDRLARLVCAPLLAAALGEAGEAAPGGDGAAA
jgi:hypothetical protein